MLKYRPSYYCQYQVDCTPVAEVVDNVGHFSDGCHQAIDIKILVISQIEISARSQFIGDRWGILKSHVV